jgi:hypothetical protein
MSEKCGDPSMSACCAIVPNTALNTAKITEKSDPLPACAIHHAVVAHADAVLAMQIPLPGTRERVTCSPPLAPVSDSVQILRI